MSNVISYRRADGVIGVGFKIEYGGIDQHSIAWPDKPAERFSVDGLSASGIESDEPKETPVEVESVETPIAPASPLPPAPELPPPVEPVVATPSLDVPVTPQAATADSLGSV